ncbi:MAG: hypothetical protein IT361_08435 [Gemmatimonadaceae bacterium]|nr:hypothetical protein [Gemmatimonadaceae bacterium]
MRLRSLALSLVLAGAAAGCSRKVVVTTPSTRDAVTLRVTNSAAQAITVVVQANGTDYTVGRVAANSTEILSVPQVASGSTVRLRATLADGSRTYSRDNVTIAGTFEWRVP